MQVAWKLLHVSGKSPSRDYGTLDFFKSKLNRTSVPPNPKNDENAVVHFFMAVTEGHLFASACNIFGVEKSSCALPLPASLKTMKSLSMCAQLLQKLVENSLTGIDLPGG